MRVRRSGVGVICWSVVFFACAVTPLCSIFVLLNVSPASYHVCLCVSVFAHLYSNF